MENYLKNRIAYLSAPIENSDGENWRAEPKKVLTEKFEINVTDPLEDPKQQWTTQLSIARKNKDYDEMTRISRNFVRKDLCLVDRSDFLIAYLPHKIQTVGCVHEIIVSDNARKPTILICPQGAEFVSLWFYGFIPKEAIFGSFEELYDYLDEVNAGKHRHNRRWDYICNLI